MGMDQSLTKTAWVILNYDGTLDKFDIIKTNKDEDLFRRCWYIAHQLLTVANSNDVKFTSLEGLAFGMMGSATRDLAGLQAVIMCVMQYVGTHDVRIVSPTAVKKFAAGGKADKTLMISSLPEEVRKNFLDAGYKKTTGLADLADAYWIAKMYQTSIQF
jgi:Holliday junction resolvasome RuvABC endonuclease subunit